MKLEMIQKLAAALVIGVLAMLTSSCAQPEKVALTGRAAATAAPAPSPTSTMSTGSATIEAATLAGMANFTGEVGDTGYDPDGNGLFEHLQVDVQVNVTEAGNFAFDAVLADASGDWIALGTLDPALDRAAPAIGATLGSGVQTVPIYFDGRSIRALGMDGPYTVSVGLSDDQGTPLDAATFTTGDYSHLDFQGHLVEVQSLSDAGVDTDSIPGYNLLRVAAQINMLAAGDVIVWGQLFAGDADLADMESVVSLDAGTHTLNLDFPGEALSASRVDGPYTVYLYFKDAYYGSDEEYTTAAYSHSEFQRPNAYLTGSISDAGADTDGDGLYDELNVTAQVAALAPGEYRLDGILEDGAGGFIQATEETIPLDSTPAEVTLRFDGLLIGRHGVDGPYHVGLVVVDANGDGLDGLGYHTSAYAYTDFELPGASFDGEFADSGVDTDGDGGYNVLRIDVGIQVTDTGVYTVTGSLFGDNTGDYITWDRQELSLEAGTHTVSLDFDGAAIREHGVDGPYRLVSLDLERADGETADSIMHAYTTAAYACTAFRPAGPMFCDAFSDQGVDTNGNGLYENLTIKVKVSIVKAGQYDFNAALIDSGTNETDTGLKEIVRASGTEYLEVGDQWIALEFDGRYIYGQQVDGPYQLGNFSLYHNYPEQDLTEGWPFYTTGDYDWHEFEPGVAISGTVSAAGKPLENVVLFIIGVGMVHTDDSGRYRLAALDTGPVTVGIERAQGPWQIWVNGKLETVGDSVTIQAVVGTEIEVNFIKAP